MGAKARWCHRRRFLAPKRKVMFGQSGYSPTRSTNIRQIEQRVRSLEQRLAEAGGRTSASAAEVAELIGNAVVPVLNRLADGFRGGANSMSDEATKLGHAVAELGNDALRRLSHAGKHRPLPTVAVAVGVGILWGLASGRPGRRPPRRRAA